MACLNKNFDKRVKWDHKNAESRRLRFYWIGPRASSFSSVVHIFSAAAKTARRRFHNRTKLQKQAFSCLLVFRSWIPMNRDASDFLSTIEPQISLSFSFDSFWASSSTSRLNTRTHARTGTLSVCLTHTHALLNSLDLSCKHSHSRHTQTHIQAISYSLLPSFFFYTHTYSPTYSFSLLHKHTHKHTHNLGPQNTPMFFLSLQLLLRKSDPIPSHSMFIHLSLSLSCTQWQTISFCLLQTHTDQ